MAVSGGVSVPSAVGTSVSFTVTGTHTLGTAQNFANALNMALADGHGIKFHDLTDGSTHTSPNASDPINEYVVTLPGAAFTLPGAGYDFVDTNGPTTLTGSGAGDTVLGTGINPSLTYIDMGGNNSVLFVTGDDFYNGNGQTGTDSIVAGAGHDTVVTGVGSDIVVSGYGYGTFYLNDTLPGHGDLVVLDDGTSRVFADGLNDTVTAATGGQYIDGSMGSASSNLVIALKNAAGNSTASNTVVAGPGTTTIYDYNANDSISGSAGSLYFIAEPAGNNAQTTINETGSGNASIFAGTGSIIHLLGNSTGTIDLVAQSTSATLDGSQSTSNLTLSAYADSSGAGAHVQSLVGGAGNDTLYSGSGSESLTGGAGHNLFDIVSQGQGSAGANITITDFGASSANQVAFLGYTSAEVNEAMNSANVSGGNLTLQFNDGVKVTFVGVDSLNGHVV